MINFSLNFLIKETYIARVKNKFNKFLLQTLTFLCGDNKDLISKFNKPYDKSLILFLSIAASFIIFSLGKNLDEIIYGI